MKFQIQILEEVYLELEEAADYYYLIRPGLEQELFKDWLESLKRIKNAPEAYQKQKNNFRQVLLNKFPCLFDGTLGSWITDPVDLVLKEPDCKPYHSRLYPFSPSQ